MEDDARSEARSEDDGNDGPDSDERPINFERDEPCDTEQGYINAQHYTFVGFGAGTLADMQLTPLLFVQIFAALWSTIVRGAVGEETSVPQSRVLSSASTAAWSTSERCGAFALPVSVLYKFSEDDGNDGPDSDERPINFERDDPCDTEQGYINAQHCTFVGFGAGTLADMQQTPLLFD